MSLSGPTWAVVSKVSHLTHFLLSHTSEIKFVRAIHPLNTWKCMKKKKSGKMWWKNRIIKQYLAKYTCYDSRS
jgi:hypothetical protein